MKHLHVSYGGPDRRIVDAAGKAWTFEDHPRLGPVVLNSNGQEMANQPRERSAFWPAWQAWKDQGKRVHADGLNCIWEKPVEPAMRHLGGCHFVLLVHPEARP